MAIRDEITRFEAEPEVLREHIRQHVLGARITEIKFDISGALIKLDNGFTVYMESVEGIGVAASGEFEAMGVAKVM